MKNRINFNQRLRLFLVAMVLFASGTLALADQDAKRVIDTYIAAVGGEEAVKSVTSSFVRMETEVQGMTLNITAKADVKNERLYQGTEMAGNVVQKTIVKDGKARIEAMGQVQELDAETAGNIVTQTYLFPELFYEDFGFEVSYVGKEKLEGKDVEVLEVATSAGSFKEYYSVESGLKLKTSGEVVGETAFSDYKSIGNGLIYPHNLSIKNPMLPMTMEMKVIELKLNVTFEDADFN